MVEGLIAMNLDRHKASGAELIMGEAKFAGSKILDVRLNDSGARTLTGQLELLGPADMNVVCFRYRSESMSDSELDALNKEILVAIQESGLAVPSNAQINARFAIRVAHTNHRTRRSDFDRLVQAVLETGRQISRTL